MRSYKITETDKGLKIEVRAQDAEKDQLLSEFQKCQQGQCTCPTQEYEKLDTLDLEITEDQINIQLIAKERSFIDRDEIARCLDHTTEKVKKGKDHSSTP